MNNINLKGTLLAVAVVAVAANAGVAMANKQKQDFGGMVEQLLEANSEKLFGFQHGLERSADERDYVARANADAAQRVLLADGLEAEFVARNVARLGDMITFWPDAENYSHLLVCIEQDRAADGRNASIQRIDVASGAVETVLYGMNRCDGIRTTAWGTVLATEEAGSDGGAYEIIDPLHTNSHWIASRDGSGDIRDAINSADISDDIVKRPTLGHFSWEGLAVLASGVVIAGDELRPSHGDEGGAMFKFIPDNPRLGAEGKIAHLEQSPLVSGTLYALQVGGTKGNWGQANERGMGKWIGPVDYMNARQWARDHNATGFYRPEDLHKDITYTGEGVRVLWTNTGRESSHNYAEVLSMVDSAPSSAESIPVVQRFVEGDARRNSFDNLDIQPGSGNVYVVEDHQYGEIHACLPDGLDQNLQSDGCVTAVSVIDPQAEPTGFIFDGSGETAYMFIQHGEDAESLRDYATNPLDGRTDDLIKITGFKVERRGH